MFTVFWAGFGSISTATGRGARRHGRWRPAGLWKSGLAKRDLSAYNDQKIGWPSNGISDTPTPSKSVMTKSTTLNRYSPAEELANSITHAVGIVLAIAGLAVRTGFAITYGNAWHIVSASIFGATMILLYTASTLYHSVQAPRGKALLRVFDHCAIFLLIAGTYTPFTLISLRGPWGWSLFGTVWALALFGIVFELSPLRRHRVVSHALYIGMGWAVIAATKPLLTHIAPGGLVLMVAGGLAYTLGIGFYALRKMRFNHAVWHIFVLVGTTLHFFAVLFYVIPVAGA